MPAHDSADLHVVAFALADAAKDEKRKKDELCKAEMLDPQKYPVPEGCKQAAVTAAK
jgi:hypothetical protein